MTANRPDKTFSIILLLVASRGKYKRSVERSELTKAAQPHPATRGRKASFPFLLNAEKRLKKAEKPFDFSPFACKLCFWSCFPVLQESSSKLITSVISAKTHVNPPSFKHFCSRNRNASKGRLYLRVLLGVSLSFLEQVLGGTYMCDVWGFVRLFCVQPSRILNLTFAIKTARILKSWKTTTQMKRSGYGIQDRVSLVQSVLFSR